MARASHLVEIGASKEKVLRAFTELNGVRGWWTEDAELTSDTPKTFHFKFGSEYQNKMEVLEETANSAKWKCVDGSDEWIGTTLNWKVEEKSTGKTILRF